MVHKHNSEFRETQINIKCHTLLDLTSLSLFKNSVWFGFRLGLGLDFRVMVRDRVSIRVMNINMLERLEVFPKLQYHFQHKNMSNSLFRTPLK